MISFALILITLPSRVAGVRAGLADRARHGESSTARPDSSLDENVVAASAGTTPPPREER